MDTSNTADDDHFVDAEVIDPVAVSDPVLSSMGPPEYVTSADFKKEKEAHLVGKEWKDRKKDIKKKAGQRKDKEEEEAANRGSGGHGGGGIGMQSTVMISVAVVAVVGVLVAVARKFNVT